MPDIESSERQLFDAVTEVSKARPEMANALQQILREIERLTARVNRLESALAELAATVPVTDAETGRSDQTTA